MKSEIKKKIEKVYLNLSYRGWFKNVQDEVQIKRLYKIFFSKELNLNNPKTFNEKLQWLKLYNRKNEFTKMVDKYEAKKYVASIIGDEHIISTLGIYDKYDDIDFDELPNQFVIKCTHDSGGLEIVKNKNNMNNNETKRKITQKLKKNYYLYGREWPYKNVKPRIIIEEYKETGNGELRDYKFFCFDGIVKFFKIDLDRFINHRANYYNPSGELLEFGEEIYPPDFNRRIEKPKKLKEMIKLAELLSKGTIFLRVDFYEVDNKIYFGELTFYPNSGFCKFIPEEWDEKLGEYIKLPINKKGD